MMDRKEGAVLCICGTCPTFISCREEIAFCLAASGKSACIKEEAGCLCPVCPVSTAEGLKKSYYCTRGSENDQH